MRRGQTSRGLDAPMSSLVFRMEQATAADQTGARRRFVELDVAGVS